MTNKTVKDSKYETKTNEKDTSTVNDFIFSYEQIDTVFNNIGKAGALSASVVKAAAKKASKTAGSLIQMQQSGELNELIDEGLQSSKQVIDDILESSDQAVDDLVFKYQSGELTDLAIEKSMFVISKLDELKSKISDKVSAHVEHDDKSIGFSFKFKK